MSNQYSTEVGSVIQTLDPTALSVRAQNRLLQYMDQEGEAAMRNAVTLQRITAVASRAIAADAYIAQFAFQAEQAVPQAAERFEEIVALTHRKICDVVGGEGRY